MRRVLEVAYLSAGRREGRVEVAGDWGSREADALLRPWAEAEVVSTLLAREPWHRDPELLADLNYLRSFDRTALVRCLDCGESRMAAVSGGRRPLRCRPCFMARHGFKPRHRNELRWDDGPRVVELDCPGCGIQRRMKRSQAAARATGHCRLCFRAVIAAGGRWARVPGEGHLQPRLGVRAARIVAEGVTRIVTLEPAGPTEPTS